MVKFFDSTEKDATIAGFGALAGAWLLPHTPQFLGVFTNLAIAIAAIGIALWINHDGISSFFIGGAVVIGVDGLVRMLIPNVATYPLLSVHALSFPSANNYA